MRGGINMVCRRKPCGSKRPNKIKNPGKNIKWSDYPSPEEKGVGHGKFCYFISCPDSKLPIRDYVRLKEKLEPHYEEKSYNECAFCNQSGIRNLRKRGGSYIIFVTRYKGRIAESQSKFYITGWFPICKWKEINLPPDDWKYNKHGEVIYKTRVAYKSDNPIFLSIDDSIELDNEKWKEWFGRNFPNNLRYVTKFIRKDQYPRRKNKNQTILEEIKNHFDAMERKGKNKIKEYIGVLR